MKKLHKGIAYFDDFYEARDVGGAEIKGHPAWRVVRYERGWAIQYNISGPYYPELQPEGLLIPLRAKGA